MMHKTLEMSDRFILYNLWGLILMVPMLGKDGNVNVAKVRHYDAPWWIYCDADLALVCVRESRGLEADSTEKTF